MIYRRIKNFEIIRFALCADSRKKAAPLSAHGSERTVEIPSRNLGIDIASRALLGRARQGDFKIQLLTLFEIIEGLNGQRYPVAADSGDYTRIGRFRRNFPREIIVAVRPAAPVTDMT